MYGTLFELTDEPILVLREHDEEDRGSDKTLTKHGLHYHWREYHREGGRDQVVEAWDNQSNHTNSPHSFD